MAGGGGSSGTQKVEQTSTTSNLPEYARPYFEGLLTQAQAYTDPTQNPYIPYEDQRIAPMTGAQQAVQQATFNLQQPGQIGAATQLASAAGLGALQAGQYDPSRFYAQRIGLPNLQQYGMQEPGMVQTDVYGAPQMAAAQTGYQPSLNYFQMQAPEQFGGVQAQQYMSPFIQQALEPQMREAATSAKRAQLVEDLGAARQGTYGGSRQLLAGMERERNLQQQLGDIYGRGMQTAYESAQTQFERDRAAQMQAQQANLQAALGVQGLGAQYGTQTALANLDAASQAQVQNLAAQLQTQGLTADQALRAALANQQAQLTTGQQNLQAALQTQQLGAQTGLEALKANQQAALEAQRLAEQSRQFGATTGLQGYQQALQAAQGLGGLGEMQQATDLSRLQAQMSAAGMTQSEQQKYLDMAYADFLRQRDYPMELLGQYSAILRGLPVTPSTTSISYAPTPSMASTVGGLGLGALGLSKMMG